MTLPFISIVKSHVTTILTSYIFNKKLLASFSLENAADTALRKLMMSSEIMTSQKETRVL